MAFWAAVDGCAFGLLPGHAYGLGLLPDHAYACDEDAAQSGLAFYLRKAEALDRHQVMRLLGEDRARNDSFAASWREAERLYEQRRYLFRCDVDDEGCGITKAHLTAVVCYTLERPNVCREFNRACRSARNTETSWCEFKFKSLWCLLIDAFKLLPPFAAVPTTLYRGVKTARSYREHDTAKFPHFVSASECQSVAERFARGGCVLALQSVPPQFVRDISLYSVYPRHQEVLIWPLCSFTVAKANVVGVKCFEFQYAAPLRAPMLLPIVPPKTADSAASDTAREHGCDTLSLKFAQLRLLCVADATMQPTVDINSIVLDPYELENIKRQRRNRCYQASVKKHYFAHAE
ncbi:hypothetical protein HPB50_011760 [Hyalomma asiaticum]|uniref:Uncharacterized protein n=1 Tax=Hyalomma asiaticum TaxID=266040 RepID=A0ACB7TIH5_HYAAI|nr:hypothetical protein HPB50_011760 [Hyalomma asiaticum]